MLISRPGKFFDESQVKPLNHEGPRFSVKGPINMGRCPQGQPLVLQAGGSERDRNLAARTADVVFSVVQDFEEAKVAYSDLKERIRRFGRDPDSVTILPGVMPIIGKTDAQARDVLNFSWSGGKMFAPAIPTPGHHGRGARRAR